MKVRRPMLKAIRFLFVLLPIAVLSSPSLASEKWPGVDETVIEKFAQAHGREASEPLINTDQGDLLLFLFLMAGAVGGFVAGYYWRVLMQERVEQVARGDGTVR